ncbi:MAG: patatin-like phospholipase family protein [Acidobacteria bacterium]|nr:patatin-like phospholipase family protein [Acidobacteriota bacterium]MDA1235564.1 patatin-like phospholipase family protein [Acidobacteriota bacterium]
MSSKPHEPVPTDVAERLRPTYLSVDELLNDLEHEVVRGGARLFAGPTLEERQIAPEHRKIALAISGGGAAGAYSAGALETLLGHMHAHNQRPDIILGTSAGALNGYGVFLEALGKDNPQLRQNPDIKQPFSTFIASIWSYLDRNKNTSEWIVGRRSWMIDLATRGVSTPLRRWGLALALLFGVFVFNPFLFVSLIFFLGLESWLPPLMRNWGSAGGPALQLAVLGGLSLVGLAVTSFVLKRMFFTSFFRDTPLLQLLSNTGPGGDLSKPRHWSREHSLDRARVLSRELVAEWYKRQDELPELIITATDITVGRECLFTLVRPETYRHLVRNGWLAVQLDCDDDKARQCDAIPGALFTRGQNLLQCVIASTAVPGAFPSQELGIYGPGSRNDVRHRFVDGGVLNNSPVHLAIDASASHVISIELDPLIVTDPLSADDRNEVFNFLETGITTFTTLLRRAIERDIRRTVTWNRFLTENPSAALERSKGKLVPGEASFNRELKRIIPLYRIAPAVREIGTAEFDGRFEKGRRTTTLRDVLRRGVLDLRGNHIWRATLQSVPLPEGQAPPK